MNRIRHLIERVHRSLKNAGVLRTIQRILQGIVPDRIFDINRVVYIQVVVKAALDESKDEPIQVELRHRWATEKDLDILMCGGLTQKQVQELFDAGARAVVTTASNGEMAAYYWMVPRHLDYFGWVRYNVAANEFWGAHNFVTPAYRGKRVAWQSRNFAYAQLLSEGYIHGTGLVEAHYASGQRPPTKSWGIYFIFEWAASRYSVLVVNGTRGFMTRNGHSRSVLNYLMRCNLGKTICCLTVLVLLLKPVYAETFTLRIGAGHPSAPIAYVDRMEHFFVPEVMRRVAETTEHEIRFIQAYAGTVAKINEILEAVEKGLLDIGGWCPCFEPSKALPLSISYFLPFTTPDVRVQVRVMRRLLDEFPELHDYLETQYGQKLLAVSGLDNYGLGTTFSWSTTDELTGRKLLGAGPNLPWISGVGAIPMSSSLVTAYNQLATGAADGFLIMPSSFYSFRLQEQASYFTVTNFGAMAQVVLTMNMETRAKLPQEVVAIIDQVAREFETVATQMSYDKEVYGLEKLREAGATVTEMAPEAQADWARTMIDWPNERTQAINAFGIDGTKIMRRYVEMLEEAGHQFPVNYPID